MSTETDKTFGTTIVSCDGPHCKMEFNHEGMDGQVDFKEAIAEAKKEGWVVKNIDGEWRHFCSSECLQKLYLLTNKVSGI